jgi:hypothetical protein
MVLVIVASCGLTLKTSISFKLLGTVVRKATTKITARAGSIVRWPASAARAGALGGRK